MSRRAARRGSSPLLARVAVVVALVVAVTGSGAGAGWALWTTSNSQKVEVVLGKTDVAFTGAEPKSVTFTDRGVPTVTSLRVTNAGTVPSTWTITSSIPSTSSDQSRALAAAIDVQMWTKGTGECGTTAPAGAVSGTWAAPPTPTGSLAAGAVADVCVRTAPTASAPAGTRVNPLFHVRMATTGTWAATREIRDFYQLTPTSWPVTVAQATCSRSDPYYARLTFDARGGAADARYAPYVGDRRIGTQLAGPDYPELAFTREDLPEDPFGKDPIRIDIRTMSGETPGPVFATGTVRPVYDEYGTRNIQC